MLYPNALNGSAATGAPLAPPVLATPKSVPAAAPVPTLLERLRANPVAPLAIWAVAVPGVLLAARLGPSGAVTADFLFAITALTLIRSSVSRAVMTGAAVLLLLVPAVTGATTAWGAVVLAAGLAVAAAYRARPMVLRRHDPQRHLEWCRRRQERAQVLVLRCEDADRLRVRLFDAFRVTDSVTIAVRDGWCEVQAVVDDHNLSRSGLERRLVELATPGVELGWAVFPDDGVTLDVLLDSARRGPSAEPSESALRPHLVRPALAEQQTSTEPTRGLAPISRNSYQETT